MFLLLTKPDYHFITHFSVPGDGLLLRRRPAHLAQQVRGQTSGGDGSVLHRRDDSCHRLHPQVKIRPQGHQAGQRPFGRQRSHQAG